MTTNSPMDDKKPPRRLKGFVASLFPAAFREDLESDLYESFRSWPEFIPKALAALLTAHGIQILNSLNVALIVAEAAVLAVCFVDGPLSPGRAAFVAIPLMGLTLRDAHQALKANPFLRTAADAAVLSIMLLLTQALTLYAGSADASPSGRLFHIAVIVLPLFSTVRLIADVGPTLLEPTQVPPGPADRAYFIAWVMLLTWAGASGGAIAFTWGNLPISHGYFLVAIFCPLPTLAFAYRAQQDTLSRIPALLSLSIVDPRRKELVAKGDRLWKVEKKKVTKPEFPWATFFETLYFIQLGLPLAFSIRSWVAGPGVGAFRMALSLTMFVTLSLSWMYIRKAFVRASEALAQELKALEDK